MLRSFFSSPSALVRASLESFGLLDLLLELDQFVAVIVLFAQLALDRLHLLVQVVFALGLLHLPLHAVTDFLLGLHDRDLALHQGVDLLQALHDIEDLKQLLLLGDLDAQVAGDAVGQFRGVVDLRDRGQRLGRDLLVQLHVVLELLDHRAAQGLGLGRADAVLLDHGDLGFVVVAGRGEAGDAGAGLALDQHLHGAVGQLQQLQDGGDHAHVIDGVRRRIVVVLVLLGGEQDLLALGAHGFFERANGLLPADKQRNRLVGEDHDVPQGQDRQDFDL